MIFKLEQIRTGMNMVWMVEKDEKNICTAILPLQKGFLKMNIDYPKEKNFLYYNPNEGNSLEERLSFKVLDNNGHRLGTIVGRNCKVKGFLQSYSYIVMNYMGQEFFLYEVGFGNKGLYLCIYQENELIAIVEKELVVKNYKDNYMVYAISEKYVANIIALVLYYDITMHGDMMEISMMSVKKKIVNTIQKELKSKFDPTFIPRIKAMDGITE